MALLQKGRAASQMIRNYSFRKITGLSVGETEAQLRATFENAAVGIAQVAPDGSCMRVNNCLCQITGYSKEELLSKTFREITHPDDLQPSLEQAQRILDGEIDGYSIEKRYLRKDGSIVWVKLTVSCVRDERGAVDYFVSVIENISKQKEAEERLRRHEAALAESERFSRRVLDNLFALVGVTGLDGTLVEVNRAPLEAAGLEHSAVIGKKVWDCYWWNYAEEMQQELICAWERAKSGETVRYDALVRMAGGSRIWFDLQLAPLRNDEEQVTHIVASAIDVTGRRQAEEALREGEARSRSIVTTAADAIVVIGEKGLIQFINEAGERMFGYEAGELLGKNVSLLIPEPYRSAHGGYIEAYLRTGQAKILGRTREIVHQRKDGSVFPGELSVSEWRAGGKRYFTGMVRDISERKHDEEKIQFLMRELSHRSKNILSIVQAIAHQTYTTAGRDFMPRFAERIQALAQSQDLLLRNELKGAGLAELIRSQLKHFSDLIGSRIELNGPPLLISAPAAQTLGMALHELATNAGKYGALTQEGGRVLIDWSCERGEIFKLSWRERGGKPVTPPSKKGFGSTVLGRLVRTSLDAKVEIDFGREGLSWRLECPASIVLEDAGSN